MHRVIKFILGLTLSTQLLGCAHAQALKETQHATRSYDWHDGSKGGLFGIGEGWSVEILHPEYVAVTVIGYMGGQTTPLIVLPAEYDWVEDENFDPQAEPEMEMQSTTIPAAYTVVTEPVVIEPARTKYDMVEPVFGAEGALIEPAKVERIFTEAVVERQERRVLLSPKRHVERLVPVEQRPGYRRVMRVPARVMEDQSQPKHRTFKDTRRQEVKPWRFSIHHLDNGAAYTFDKFEDYKRFTESLK